MTSYTAALIAGIWLLSLGAYDHAGFWVAVGVASCSAALHLTYLVQRRAAGRMPEAFKQRRLAEIGGLTPEHRVSLDRWVLGQWLCIALLGAGGGAVLGALGWEPFESAGLVFEVLVVGWVVLWAGVYLSSLIDWFLILPKVSGISCPAPCERPGKQRWAGITGLWCVHRGAAMVLVPLVIVGCPTVIAAVTDDAAGQAIGFALAALFSVLLIEFEAHGKTALGYGFNTRRYLGDRVWLVHESGESVSHHAAYLMDVSAEGAKFKFVDDTGRYSGPEFEDKHDDDGPPITLGDALDERPRVKGAVAPCGEKCSGINWYCWRNPLAYSQTTSTSGD